MEIFLGRMKNFPEEVDLFLKSKDFLNAPKLKQQQWLIELGRLDPNKN